MLHGRKAHFLSGVEDTSKSLNQELTVASFARISLGGVEGRVHV